MRKRMICVAVISLGIMLSALVISLVVYFSMDYEGIVISNREAVTEAIRTGLKNRSEILTVHFTARTQDLEEAQSQTERLFLDALYESDDPAGGDYIRCQLGGYDIHSDAKRRFLTWRYTMELRPVYYSTREEEDFVDAEIQSVLSDAPMSGTKEEQIRWVHDLVTETLSYDHVHKNHMQSHGKTTAYAALKYHQAVCQGYAVLTYRLLKELGIDCRIVMGDAMVEDVRERHAWIMVETEEGKRYMDPTLDDVYNCDTWYMKTEEEFATDHMET